MKALDDVLFHKLCVILKRSWCEARNGAMRLDRQQIQDLADTMEILPSLLAEWHDDSLTIVRQALAVYQNKYAGSAYDYLSILDMEETAFRAVFLALNADWGSEAARANNEPLSVA